MMEKNRNNWAAVDWKISGLNLNCCSESKCPKAMLSAESRCWVSVFERLFLHMNRWNPDWQIWGVRILMQHLVFLSWLEWCNVL